MVCDYNWSLVVDCAEGTLRQFAWQPYRAHRLKVSRLTKIFITHMHGKISNVYVATWHNIHTADHTMGLVTILRSALGMPQLDAGASHKMVCIILT
jgi:ribonuclease Z